ncbi:MAG TPA: RnfABCDGE type electron transport complex subunit D [Feifaniaceae bacterium]|nr:RnfABCDGE type electron transport complex subunit D [Feifaniaceae bacterium]
MKLNVSPSPHIRAPQDTRSLMRDVLLALLPACVMGIYRFGYRALLVLLLCAASAVLTELVLHRLLKRPATVGDLSAAVTGVLLGMNLPASAPWWMCVLGGVFAIGLVKVPFGGIGNNFVNPALAARGFLLASFPVQMTAWTAPANSFLAPIADAVSTATPLSLLADGGAALAAGAAPAQDFFTLALGNTGGCIGEVSSIALLIGFLYLLVRSAVSWRIPLVYVATVFLGVALLGGGAGQTGYAPVWTAAMHTVSGGLLLGACFMATDYSTSPVTPKGQFIYALGCGILTVVIRLYGGYPEGVSYSILVMNLCVPLIERYMRARVYGEVKGHA